MSSHIGRIILHIDMNCFFVSCEIAENEQLRGRIVAVAGSSARKGIILSASYEARQFGIRSAMSVMEALSLCPQLVIVEPHMDLYGEYSRQFFDYFLEITPLVEPGSIDEGYLDVTDVCPANQVVDLANTIQKTLLEKFHLPSSIGIAPNKMLAKMASDLKKPLGISILRKRDVPEKIWPMPVGCLTGVGKKTNEKLKILNIFTIGQLANYTDIPLLEKLFGVVNAKQLIEQANGHGDNIVDISRFTDVSSISNSQTLEYDEYDQNRMLLFLKILNNAVVHRLESQNLKAQNVTLQIKYNNFKLMTRSKTLEKATNNDKIIMDTLFELFDDFYDNRYGVRLLGVGISKLTENTDEIKQMSFFDQLDQEEKDVSINNLLNEINNIQGSVVLKRGVSNETTDFNKYDRRWSRSLREDLKNISK